MEQSQESKQPRDDDKSLRELTPEECTQVAGGWGDACYYSYSSGTSASYTANNSDAKN